MNAQLRLKLIQCQAVIAATTPRAPKAPTLHLLGEGLDAIIQHTGRPAWGFLRHLLPSSYDPRLPSMPDATHRLNRYRDAAMLYGTDKPLFERREYIGESLLASWKLGRFPKLRRSAQLVGLPTRRALTC